jgi:hypothetical protein
MLNKRRQGHPKRRSKLADAGRALAQAFKHAPPGGVRKRPEYGVDGFKRGGRGHQMLSPLEDLWRSYG